MKEYQIQLFNGEEYRFVFNRAYAPGIEIEIYNKPKDKSKRKLLFSSKDSNDDLIYFEPVTIPNVFVDVIIPDNVSNRDQGCVTLMVGYELVFLD